MTENPGKKDCSGSEETHVVDRLNPSRNMISSIESQYAEQAENTQKVMVNMMCDLRCELVVTLGDARLSPEQEDKLMKEHRGWEEFKVGAGSGLLSRDLTKHFVFILNFQRKYEWKPAVKVKEKKEKPVRKVKVAKRKVQSKVDIKSPDAGKENAVQTWKNIFSPKNITSPDDKSSQPKKKVLKKSKPSKNSTEKQTGPMLNFLVVRGNTENH